MFCFHRMFEICVTRSRHWSRLDSEVCVDFCRVRETELCETQGDVHTTSQQNNLGRLPQTIHTKTNVVISQTHWLVSQERLSPRAGTSVFIEYSAAIWRAVVLNSQLVCHTTLLPHQGALASTDNFKYSEYFYNKY